MSDYINNAIKDVTESLDESTSEHDREMAYYVVDILNFLKNQPNYVVTWDAQWSLLDSSNFEQVYFKVFQSAKEKFPNRFEDRE